MVLKIPDRDYSGVSQVRLLDGILRRRNEYAGGFIMVNEADVIRADLARFCGEAGMPVVFVDAEPFESENAYPPGTAFVGCDDGEIGTAAAQWVGSYLRRERVKRPAVLVINGVRYQQRERMFQKVLESEIAGVQLTGDCARFDRAQAREVARTHLRRLEATGRKLHAVFCTNDEMALGVTDALLHANHLLWARDTVVAGVDGTPDARAQIEAGPSPLRATVVQDSSKVAEAAVGLMEKMIRKKPVPIRTSVAVEILARD
jgi:ribose transport system substrate-binding protein